ncbi:hypothetical protein PQX77_014327 [Marasmius sp. AFHP31]|nr:hypothetical protein PQX77_014327 [Marasmius sp. AFHP31]
MLEAWNLLAPHLARCEKLVLQVAHMDIFPAVPNLAFPFLMSFQYSVPEHHRVEDPPGTRGPQADWFWKAINGAPQLRVLDLARSLPPIVAPYRQLISLTVFHRVPHSVESFLRILPSCRALVSLSLDFPYCPPTVADAIELPSLRELTFGTSLRIVPEVSALEICCPKLILPSLTKFRATCSGWPPALSTMLQRCAITLEALTIKFCVFESGTDSPGCILDLLPSFFQLTDFALTLARVPNRDVPSHIVTNTFTSLLSKLNWLGVSSDSATRCNLTLPKLQSVRLRFSDVDPNEHINRVLDVVSSRLQTEQAYCSLKYFHLSACKPWKFDQRPSLVVSEEARERMQEFRKRGTHVVFDISNFVLLEDFHRLLGRFVIWST